MTDAEYHQQQLEQQEQEETSARIKSEDGSSLYMHIWSDNDSVYLNVSRDCAMKSTVFLSIEQAEVMVKLLNNALRRAR